jgi:hypothetical protein
VRVTLNTVPPALRSQERTDCQGVHRQHDGDAHGQQGGVAISDRDGGTASPLPVVRPIRIEARYEISPVRVEPVRGPVFEAAQSDRLPATDQRDSESWWWGESEHDYKLDWSGLDLVRPPLEMLPIVPGRCR